MSLKTKIWLIVATVLVVAGTVIFVVTLSNCGWDLSKLNPSDYETNTYEIKVSFETISIRTDTADLAILPAEDGIAKVVCFEKNSSKHTVSAKNGQLEILVTDERKWYQRLFDFCQDEITVYLPQPEYTSLTIDADTSDIVIEDTFCFGELAVSTDTGDVITRASANTLQITMDTGDILVEHVTATALSISLSTGCITATDVNCTGDMILRVTTGDTTLTGVTCGSLRADGSTGDITLRHVIATENMVIERSTGDVRLEEADAAEICITTDTGDVRGTILTEKVFFAKTDTGDVHVPKTTSGGRCEITTDTGDIELRVG